MSKKNSKSFSTANDAIEKQISEDESALQTTGEEDVWAVVGDLKFLTPETLEILKQRAKEWHELYPLGEPMYKRDDDYQAIIHVNQVMHVLQVSERTAQRILQTIRVVLGKERRDYVSVKEFCHHIRQDEEEIRKALKSVKGNFKFK